MEHIKVGIIGFGDIGRKRYNYLRGYSYMFKVAGVYDTTDINSRDTPIKFYDSIERLYQDVDVVFIATPHRYTSQLVINSLDANKHVFSEKPPGLNLQETKEIRKTLEKHPNLKLKFGFNHRYHSSIMDAHEIGKQLGNLVWLRGIMGKGKMSGWRVDKNISGGGILLGQGIHMLDIFNLFIESPFIKIQSMIHYDPETQLEDNVFAIMRNSDKVMAELHSSSLLWDKTFDFQAGYTNGYVRVQSLLTSEGIYGPLKTETLTTLDNGVKKVKEYYQPEDSWGKEILDFGMNIQDNTPVKWGSIKHAMETMRIINEIHKQDNCHN